MSTFTNCTFPEHLCFCFSCDGDVTLESSAHRGLYVPLTVDTVHQFESPAFCVMTMREGEEECIVLTATGEDGFFLLRTPKEIHYRLMGGMICNMTAGTWLVQVANRNLYNIYPVSEEDIPSEETPDTEEATNGVPEQTETAEADRDNGTEDIPSNEEVHTEESPLEDGMPTDDDGFSVEMPKTSPVITEEDASTLLSVARDILEEIKGIRAWMSSVSELLRGLSEEAPLDETDEAVWDECEGFGWEPYDTEQEGDGDSTLSALLWEEDSENGDDLDGLHRVLSEKESSLAILRKQLLNRRIANTDAEIDRLTSELARK